MKLINLIKCIRRKRIYKKMISHDVKQYIDHSCVFSENNLIARIERDILVYSHIVEKGIAHKKFKVYFGKDIVCELSKHVCTYYEYVDKNKYIYDVGVSALSKYIKYNRNNGVDVTGFAKLPSLEETDKEYIGINTMTAAEFFSKVNANFADFSESRKSVRLYDEKSENICENEIYKILSLAKNAPSACNRQAVRVHVVQNEEFIKKVAEIQEGCKGFGENAGVMFIITSDLNYYLPLERKIPMFDCGIYAMNLLYSIHYNKFAACILNGSMSKENEQKIKMLLEIKDNEMLASIIVMYKVKDDSEINVGVTMRRDARDVCRFSER